MAGIDGVAVAKALGELIAERNALKAELEAARPLLEAVMEAGISSIPGVGMDSSDIMAAALAYRESQKPKED